MIISDTDIEAAKNNTADIKSFITYNLLGDSTIYVYHKLREMGLSLNMTKK